MRGFPLLLFLAGCIPYPTMRTFVPRTVGALTADGEPVAGVRVYRTEDVGETPCRAVPETVAETGGDGRFDLPGVSRSTLDVFIPMAIMESPRQWWSMCFVSGADTLIHRDSAIPPHAIVRYACETTAFVEARSVNERSHDRGCETLCMSRSGSDCSPGAP